MTKAGVHDKERSIMPSQGGHDGGEERSAEHYGLQGQLGIQTE